MSDNSLIAAAKWLRKFDASLISIHRAQYESLMAALEDSVKQQSHYADLLNMYDGGKRLIFANADEWMKRLAALRAAGIQTEEE